MEDPFGSRGNQIIIPAHAAGATDRLESSLAANHLKSCSTFRTLLADCRSLGDDLLYAMPALAAPGDMAEQPRHYLISARGWGASGWRSGGLRGLRSARTWAAMGAAALPLLMLSMSAGLAVLTAWSGRRLGRPRLWQT